MSVQNETTEEEESKKPLLSVKSRNGIVSVFYRDGKLRFAISKIADNGGFERVDNFAIDGMTLLLKIVAEDPDLIVTFVSLLKKLKEVEV